MVKCSEIADSVERLKCFDAAVPRAKSALTAPTPQVKEKSLLDWFGVARQPKPVTKPEEFGKPEPEPAPEEEINELRATVVEFARTSRRMRALFVLDNGQVWRQLDGDTADVRDPPPDTTMKVTIERGVLRSYNLMIDGRNGIIKVSRLK